MRVSLAVGSNYFIEIAKFRAFRVLWNWMLAAFGVPEERRSLHLHARTGLFNKTIFDPYVNMLRTTVEAFAAVVGGVDSLHVGPFDEVLREPDTFSHRIARNTHLILSEECGLNQVIDPAGGSWAVEKLTSEMAEKAWTIFQKIEGGGGILPALRSGSVQDEVEAVRVQKAKHLQQRRAILVGTNQYPNATEQLLEKPPVDYRSIANSRAAEVAAKRPAGGPVEVDTLNGAIAAAEAGATIGQLHAAEVGNEGPGLEVKPVLMKRGGEDSEKLRFAAMDLRGRGTPPVILQVNMGPSRRYRLRADWTMSFFQVAGIEVLGQDDFNTVEEAVQALETAGARVAVLTSDDEAYADAATEWAGALKAAQPGLYLILAGDPGENEPALREAGVDDFVHLRVNNYTMNRDLLERLGGEISE